MATLLILVLVIDSPIGWSEEATASEPPDPAIAEVDEAFLKSLPVFATLECDSLIRDHVGSVVEIGKVFTGRPFPGRVILKNNTADQLILGRPEASCGCLVISPAEPEVPPGESTDVVVGVHRMDTGPFAVKVDITLNGQPVTLRFRGDAEARFSTRPDAIEIGNDGMGSFDLICRDDAVTPKDLSLRTRRDQFRVVESTPIEDGLRVKLKAVAESTAVMQTDAFIDVDGRTANSLTLRFVYPGRLVLLQRRIYLSRNDAKLRLFLRGDAKNIAPVGKKDQLNGELRVGTADWFAVAASYRMYDANTHEMKIDNPFLALDPGLHRVELKIDPITIPFEIFLRE